MTRKYLLTTHKALIRILLILSILIMVIVLGQISGVNAQIVTSLVTATSSVLPSPSPTSSLDEKMNQLSTQVAEFGQRIESPPKDIWDKLQSISGLVSGGIIALIGLIATLVYNERQRRAEEASKKEEIDILRIQTLKDFMPQLQSGDDKAVEAALLAITALGDQKLATELARLYRTEGARVALSKILPSPIEAINLAKHSIEAVARNESSILILDDTNHERMLQQYVCSIRRGIRVRMILISDDLTPHLTKSIREYQRAGIEVRIASPSYIQAHDLLYDLLIIDNQLVFSARHFQGEQGVEWDVSQDQNQLRIAKQSFEEIWASSMTFQPL